MTPLIWLFYFFASPIVTFGARNLTALPAVYADGISLSLSANAINVGDTVTVSADLLLAPALAGGSIVVEFALSPTVGDATRVVVLPVRSIVSGTDAYHFETEVMGLAAGTYRTSVVYKIWDAAGNLVNAGYRVGDPPQVNLLVAAAGWPLGTLATSVVGSVTAYASGTGLPSGMVTDLSMGRALQVKVNVPHADGKTLSGFVELRRLGTSNAYRFDLAPVTGSSATDDYVLTAAVEDGVQYLAAGAYRASATLLVQSGMVNNGVLAGPVAPFFVLAESGL